MKNNQVMKYFKLSLKRNIMPSLIYLVIYSLIYLVTLLTKRGGTNLFSTEVGLIVCALAVTAYIDPFVSATYFMNKKSIDNLYSLPIKRNMIMTVKLLSGIIRVLVPFTIVYYLGMFILLSKFPNINAYYYLPLYITLVISFVCVYVFNYFFLTRANKISDGVVFVLFANLAVFILITLIAEILLKLDFENIKYSDVMYYGKCFLPFYSFIECGNTYNEFIISNYKLGIAAYKIPALDPLPLILTINYGIIGSLLLYLLSKFKKPEDAEELSNSYFGYSVMIPYYTTCGVLLFSIGISDFFTTIIVFSIGYIILSIIQYRSFKIPPYRWLMLAGIMTIPIILSIVTAVIK